MHKSKLKSQPPVGKRMLLDDVDLLYLCSTLIPISTTY